MTTRSQRLGAQIQELRAQLIKLAGDREVAALRVVEEGGNAEALEAAQKVDAAIAKVNVEIEQLSAARRAAARFDAIQARADRLAQLRAQRADAVKAAEDRVVVAVQLEDWLTRGKVLLQQWETLTSRCVRVSVGMATDVIGREAWLSGGGTGIAQAAAAMTGGVGEAFAGALVAAGVGIVGPQIPAMRDIGDALRANIKDAAALDAARLSDHLGRLVESVILSNERADEPAVLEAEDRQRRLHAFGGAIPTFDELRAAPLTKD